MSVIGERNEEMRREYEVGQLSMNAIAKRHGISQTQVYRIFKGMGVETSRAVVGKVVVRCGKCGEEFKIARSQARRRKRTFCSRCWGTIQQRGKGEGLARTIVRAYWRDRGPLPIGAYIHFRDGDMSNVAPDNLMVFDSVRDFEVWRKTKDKGLILWRLGDVP